MSPWRIAAHVRIDPLPTDWQDQLALRLGKRPRRIGRWAELALYGARLCLDAAQEAQLSPGAKLRVASRNSSLSVFPSIAGQARAGLLMPFAFMQSQPSQMLAALSQCLAWQGDACFTLSRDPDQLLQLAQLDCSPAGLLMGWVDEDLRTEWWRLLPQ